MLACPVLPCPVLACPVLAAAADVGVVAAAGGPLSDVAGVLFEHAATARTAKTIDVLPAIPFLTGAFPTYWASDLARDSLA